MRHRQQSSFGHFQIGKVPENFKGNKKSLGSSTLSSSKIIRTYFSKIKIKLISRRKKKTLLIIFLALWNAAKVLELGLQRPYHTLQRQQQKSTLCEIHFYSFFYFLSISNRIKKRKNEITASLHHLQNFPWCQECTVLSSAAQDPNPDP